MTLRPEKETATISKRELNKQEKRERILKAAREAFRRNGYEATTLREVAAAAHIGSGTLFLYAPTKEALLIAVFEEELGPVFDSAFATLPPADLKARLLHVFALVTEHHALHRELALPFLREMLLIRYPERAQLRAFVESWQGRITDLVRAARERGEVADRFDPESLASHIIDLFLAGLRRWMNDSVTRGEYTRALDEGLELLLTGAAP